MSTEPLQVGDVCEIVLSTECPTCRTYHGAECTIVVGARVADRQDCQGVFVRCLVYTCRVRDGRLVFLRREELRKKRPPASDDQVIRQETIPRATFDAWLDGIRRQAKEETTT